MDILGIVLIIIGVLVALTGHWLIGLITALIGLACVLVPRRTRL